MWNASFPAYVKYTHDMKAFNWKHTQYSEFNASDTMIMVSGVYKGSDQTTHGEIAVFSVVGSHRSNSPAQPSAAQQDFIHYHPTQMPR